MSRAAYGRVSDHATTVHGRYQVTCTWCEDIEHYQTKTYALEAAARDARSHPDNAAAVQVYDVMARHGSPELWSAEGAVLRYREAAQGRRLEER